LTAEEKEKFSELVALLARHGFGAAGPPRETTFAQIEKFGHQAGRMVAGAIDSRLAEQHAAHFAGEETCPSCGEKHLSKESPHDLGLQTEDGDDWRPARLFRTGLSSLEDSDAFGRMMEVEADARGFYHAAKKAFVSDGLPYNWVIQKRHFHDFTPILDFVHAVEHLYEAARCVHDDAQRRWMDYLRWARECWGGNVPRVIAELREHQRHLGLPPKDCEKTDPRKVLADAVGYFQNNVSRMDYPAYRRQGLPTTSAHMESFVKEINARVKGTEKFWNDGASGEAILQIRAAALCEDDRLSNFLHSRPGHPFHPNVPRHPSPTAAS
ncbi:MAG: hypothetical protein NTW96_00060, partial [Planctomycetia bacterium]|nr:hypothetical protein [Planctomycetia bacterium]